MIELYTSILEKDLANHPEVKPVENAIYPVIRVIGRSNRGWRLRVNVGGQQDKHNYEIEVDRAIKGQFFDGQNKIGRVKVKRLLTAMLNQRTAL